MHDHTGHIEATGITYRSRGRTVVRHPFVREYRGRVKPGAEELHPGNTCLDARYLAPLGRARDSKSGHALRERTSTLS